MNQSDRIFRLSKTELLCLVGVGLFLLSLALPAAKMGAVHTGLALFTLGTFTAFVPGSIEVSIMSLLALVLNCSCAFVLVTIFMHWKSGGFLIGAVVVGTLCSLLLWLRPYSGIEELYIGYHLWIVSTLWILWVPVVANGQAVRISKEG